MQNIEPYSIYRSLTLRRHKKTVNIEPVNTADDVIPSDMVPSNLASADKDSVTSNEHEITLIERIANNRDSKALEELYLIYHPRLAGYLRRMISQDDKISEHINDVMLLVWKYAKQFKGSSKVSTWIFTIAYREFCRILKKEKRQQKIMDEVAERQFVENIHENKTEASDIESSDIINKALEYLPPEQRITIELHYFSGNSISEISEITNSPENTVKTRMFHARRKLRDVVNQLSMN